MNQTQRKFLLDAIETQYSKERDELKDQKPREPSLNNFLIAAILDKSFKLKSQESIRQAVHDRVLRLGKSNALVGSSRYADDDDANGNVSLPASVLFETPPPYRALHDEYKRDLEEWNRKMKNLDDSISAMRIKVQLGSDASLGALVDQADKLCSMSLTTSSTLMLQGGK